MAERVGFEPTERFPVHSISSAANSTTLAPLQHFRLPISDCQLVTVGTWPALAKDQSKIGNRKSTMYWRRGGDSNPRWALTHSGFRDRCTNTLCDLSAKQKSDVRDQSRMGDPRLTSDLLLLKNPCISSRHSDSSTPLITSTRWFS